MLYTFFLLFHPNKTKAHGSHSSYLFSWFGYIHSYSVLSLSLRYSFFCCLSEYLSCAVVCTVHTRCTVQWWGGIATENGAHEHHFLRIFHIDCFKSESMYLILILASIYFICPRTFFLFFFLLLSLHRHTSIYFLYIYRKYRINRNICTIWNDLEWEWMRERNGNASMVKHQNM